MKVKLRKSKVKIGVPNCEDALYDNLVSWVVCKDIIEVKE